ncbi:MAG: CvpA family protein [Muribaculaceae bacterium]|nr:CvpA family protein [Muribaculaceae bacterium]
MSTFAIITIIIVLAAFITGAVKGFVRQAGTLVGMILGVVACRVWGDDFARFIIGSGTEHHTLLTWVAYALLFVVAYIAVVLIARLLRKFLHAMALGFVDRLAGGLLRVCIWMLFYSLALNIYLAVRPSERASLVDPKRPWTAWVVNAAPRVFGTIINQDYADLVNTSKTHQ